MRTPKILEGAVRTAAARAASSKGTKFLNSAIPEEMTSKDLLGVLAIAVEDKRPTWYIKRLHGVFTRRRLYEERAQLGV